MSDMKQWPDNNQPAAFTDLAEEGVQAIRFAYKCDRQNEGQDIPLLGPDAPESSSVPAGSAMLTAEQLKYSEEEQGRDALDEIVGVILRIGIEQGRRITVNSPEVKMIADKLASIKSLVNSLVP